MQNTFIYVCLGYIHTISGGFPVFFFVISDNACMFSWMLNILSHRCFLFVAMYASKDNIKTVYYKYKTTPVDLTLCVMRTHLLNIVAEETFMGNEEISRRYRNLIIFRMFVSF